MAPPAPPVDALSVREREILSRVAAGWSNFAIRRELWITQKTLETHMCRIYRKLGLAPDGTTSRRVRAALAWRAATNTGSQYLY